MTEIYFDNSATTKQLKNVTEVMNRTVNEFYGNPSSLHSLGYRAEQELRRNRQIIANVINSDEKEIYFTSGGSESNNWALLGYLRANPRKGNHVLISATEHPSVLECGNFLKKNGYIVDYIPVGRNGICDPDWVYSRVNDDTAIVSVMHVNSETGAVFPIEDICKAVKSKNKNTVFHTDCVQSFCKIKIDIKKMGADLLSVSGHKIGGPRGIGVLYINKNTRIEPFILGGGQERGMRSGTENLPAISGLAYAAEVANSKLEDSYLRVKEISRYIENNLREKAYIVTDTDVSSPYVLNISFPSLRGEVILHALESKGVFVSVGSACSSNKKSRSHVLKAMGLSNDVIDGAIRLSFSPNNIMDEANIFVNIINEEVAKLSKTR